MKTIIRDVVDFNLPLETSADEDEISDPQESLSEDSDESPDESGDELEWSDLFEDVAGPLSTDRT